jgi:hypothetical protein
MRSRLQRLVPRLVTRLEDQRGMALVMAIGISFVLAIAAASVVLFTTSNERHATRQNATTRLYDIAQGGIDDAASQLGGLPSSSASLYDPAFFTSMPVGNRTAAMDGGTVIWTGTLTDATPPYFTWRLQATATMPDPANSGNTLTRTLSADLNIVPKISQTVTNTAWRYIYSRNNDNDVNTCDQAILNNPGITSSFYVNGDFCLDNSSNIYGPQTPGVDPDVNIVVKGRAYLNHPSTSIGTVSRPVTYVEAVKGCDYRGTQELPPPAVPSSVCTSTTKVWPNSVYSGGPTISAPVAAYSTWWAEASPGPNHPCEQTSGGTPPAFESTNELASPVMNSSAGIVDITPAYSYTCIQRGGGQLSWDNTSKVLTVAGTIFIDGSVDFSSDGVITYSGMAAIYATGSFRLRQTQICSQVSGGACASPWTNAETNVLLLVAKGSGSPAQSGAGITLEQASAFQGALFAEANMTFENNTWVQGPMIANSEIIANSMFFHYIPPLVNVPFGTPGQPIVDYYLAPVRHYSG